MTGITTDPNDPDIGRGPADTAPVPQNKKYLVLSSEEIAKGFTRPLRDSYVHVGLQPQHPLRDLTPEENERFNIGGHTNYVKFEVYPPSESPRTGRFWTQEQLDTKGCRTSTKMGYELSATYAREPGFYGSTYCVHCRMHRPVEEFVWEGTDERVGS